MTPAKLELLVSELLDRVVRHQVVESQVAELKAEWPDPPEKAARQLAGHANAARGERILWIIGADEKSGTISTPAGDHLQWWQRVRARFDELAPDLLFDIAVPYQGQTVRALMFETQRAPYVVKVGDTDRLEVPWREATGTRSARHSDLIRVLVPELKVPDVEPLDGLVWMRGGEWRMSLELYVTPHGRARVVIPFHRCQAELILPDAAPISLERISLGPSVAKSGTIRGSSNEVLIDGPGLVVMVGFAPSTLDPNRLPAVVRAKVTLRLAGDSEPLALEVGFRYDRTSDPDTRKWHYVATA